MEFKKVVPEEDGYYFAYAKKSWDVEILKRTSESFNGKTIVYWWAMGFDDGLTKKTLDDMFFGDKIELPNVPKL